MVQLNDTVINLKLNQGRVRVMVVNNISVIWWQFFFIGGGKTGSKISIHFRGLSWS
jgi:hypothetical protein